MATAYKQLRDDITALIDELAKDESGEACVKTERRLICVRILQLLVSKYPETFDDGTVLDAECANGVPWYDCVSSDSAVKKYISDNNGWPKAPEAVVPQLGDSAGHLVNRLYVASKALQQHSEDASSKAAANKRIKIHMDKLMMQNSELRERVSLLNSKVLNRDRIIKQYENMNVLKALAHLECENNSLRRQLNMDEVPYSVESMQCEPSSIPVVQQVRKP